MIAIIGAGPAGSYLANLLKNNGHEVELFEEHKVVGKPVQCTGILTSSVESLIKVPEELIVNYISRVNIIAPDGNNVEIKFRNKNKILDRAKFDQHLVGIAERSGVKVNLGKSFESLSREHSLKIKFKDNTTIEVDKVVGADGPFSKVAKSAGLFGDRKFIQAIQARVRMNVEPDTIIMYPGIGEFAWIVPENDNIARVGIVDRVNAAKHFNNFFKNSEIIEYQSGVIPIYSQKAKTQIDNIALMGDAACMVKSTTYGGILYGLKAAEAYAKNPDNYEKTWRKSFGLELYLSFQMRKILNKFSLQDYNDLIKYFNKPSLKNILEVYDRDYPSKFILKMLKNEPRLLKYSFRIF